MRRFTLMLGLFALFTAPAAAQVPLVKVRLGAHAAMPTGDLSNGYNAGFGAYGRVGLPMGPMNLMASATWTRLKGKNVTLPVVGTVGTPDSDVISLQAGPHFSLALLDVGVEGAYYSGDGFNKIGLAPNVSLGLLNFDLTASYNIALTDPSNATWLTVGAGFRF